MSKERVQPWAVGITIFLLAAAAVGYLFAPAQMFAVVGLAAVPDSVFLAQTLAAAFVGMLPMAWQVRRRRGGAGESAVLAGLALYMFVGSGVDLVAYFNRLVGFAAVPSIGFRTVLGLVLAWLALPWGARR